MKVILIGPPGVGKGTQSHLLQKQYGFQSLSSGEILRQEVTSKSDLGEYIKTFLESGLLLPDKLIVEVMMKNLDKINIKSNSILFYGFPRTIEQAKELEKRLNEKNTTIDTVIIFEASSAVILERLSGRLTCPKCNAIYHVKNCPPIHPETCDQCQILLYVRTDDKNEAILKRLELYNTTTQPLIEYYVSLQKAHKINAERSSKEVFDSVCQILNISN